jgi:hypothetical protein
VVEASIDTADFNATLLLLDANGNTISDDIGSGGSGTPLIKRQLWPGDYRLIVFDEDAFGGNYALNYQYAPGPAEACPVNRIDSGSQISGILSGDTSCKDGGFLSDIWKVVLPSDGTVNLTLSSPDFFTFLDIHDSKDNALTWGAQSSDGSISTFTADLPAGTYYIDTASMDLPGGYILSYTFTPKALAACPAPMQMPPNGYIHNAQLGPASCQGVDGRRADFYQFTLPAASTQAMFMISGSLQPDVVLYRQDGTPLRSDQNSYADGNAVIVQYLSAGSYLVRARGADPTAEGLYDLDLLFLPGGPPQLCAPRALPSSGTVSGATSITSCAWYDNTFADIYRMTVSDSAQVVTAGAHSDVFATSLVLLDGKGNVLATDDNDGGGSDALVAQPLAPGNYYIVVKPAGDPTHGGSYILTTGAEPLPQVVHQVSR